MVMQVTVKAAYNSIDRDARKVIVGRIVPLLITAFAGLNGDRVYTIFEELPVENLAVGSSIMMFDMMHTAQSVGGSKESDHLPNYQ